MRIMRCVPAVKNEVRDYLAVHRPPVWGVASEPLHCSTGSLILGINYESVQMLLSPHDAIKVRVETSCKRSFGMSQNFGFLGAQRANRGADQLKKGRPVQLSSAFHARPQSASRASYEPIATDASHSCRRPKFGALSIRPAVAAPSEF